jgi:hypothetical protein
LNILKNPLWSNRNFQLLWGGQTASIFGDRVTDIALPWLILLQTHSPLDAAVITAMRYVPVIVFGLTIGVVADRIDKRTIMILSDIGRAIALFAVALLGITHHIVPLWVLALVVLMLGIGQTCFQIAYRAWIPDVSSDELLMNANAALESSDALSTLIGPAIGGGLIQALGPATSLGTDALSYLISAVSLVKVRLTHQPGMHMAQADVQVNNPPTELLRRHFGRELLEGIQVMVHSSQLRLLLGVSTAMYVSSATIAVLIAALAQLRLHLSPWQAGFVFASAGAGGLLANAYVPRLAKVRWHLSLMIAYIVASIGIAGFILVIVLGPTQLSFGLALLANFILDGAVSLCFVITGTVGTLLTPQNFRGRVNGVWTIYSSVIRGLGLITVGVILATGSYIVAFLVLLLGYAGGALALLLAKDAGH